MLTEQVRDVGLEREMGARLLITILCNPGHSVGHLVTKGGF